LTANDLPTNQLGPTKLSELENDTGFITSSSSITGNAATADKLNTARTITIAGAVAGSVQFDGSSDVTLTVTLGDDIKIDASDITGLTVDYADIKNAPEVYTKTEIDNLIGDLETELDEI
jgi:cytoskeletal protein CcmA (bactofilin family)